VRPQILEHGKALAIREAAQEAGATGSIGEAVIFGNDAHKTQGRLPAVGQDPEQMLDLGAWCILNDGNPSD
jgi:hypothetical protein